MRSIENALNIEVPLNAQYIRNMMMAAHATHDHIVHFYILSALDWVDITSALKADPKKAAQLADGLSPWPRNSYQELQAVQDKLKAIVASGQLGIFRQRLLGAPGHEAPPGGQPPGGDRLPPGPGVSAQDQHGGLHPGEQDPHVQNLIVGGVSSPINLDSPSA